jgi:hypothetical protein
VEEYRGETRDPSLMRCFLCILIKFLHATEKTPGEINYFLPNYNTYQKNVFCRLTKVSSLFEETHVKQMYALILKWISMILIAILVVRNVCVRKVKALLL